MMFEYNTRNFIHAVLNIKCYRPSFMIIKKLIKTKKNKHILTASQNFIIKIRYKKSNITRFLKCDIQKLLAVV